MPGVIHCASENEQSNSIFKALPPRKNYYKIVVTNSADSSLSGDIFFDILNLNDPAYPIDISTEGDRAIIEKDLSQIKFNPISRIGDPIEIKMTLYTDELLRLAADPSEISIAIYDFDWRSICS